MKKPQTFKYTDEVDKAIKKIFDEYQNLFDYKKYKKGDTLLAKGETITHDFLVIEGIIKASINSPRADGEAILTFFGPGNSILPYRSDLPENSISSVTFEVYQDAKIQRIHKDSWEKIRKENPLIDVIMQDDLFRVLERMMVQAEINTHTSAEKRFRLWREVYPFLDDIDTENIAARMGISEATAKRVK